MGELMKVDFPVEQQIRKDIALAERDDEDGKEEFEMCSRCGSMIFYVGIEVMVCAFCDSEYEL